MRYVYPLILESKARPKGLGRKPLSTLAPLIFLVWFAYWIGMVSQTCCAPLVSDSHANSIPCADDHDGHHDNALAAHEPAAPSDHGNCPQLKSVELVPVSVASTSSVSKLVLIAFLPASILLPAFSTSNPPTRHFLDQPSQPPPSPYLRTRRLLI
jgi:hypothetical protein